MHHYCLRGSLALCSRTPLLVARELHGAIGRQGGASALPRACRGESRGKGAPGMTPEQARPGTRVRVTEHHRVEQRRGLVGTIVARYGGERT